MKTNLISIRAIDREWKRIIDWDIDEAKLLALASSAAKLVQTPNVLNRKIALIDIKQYSQYLPDDFSIVNQVAFRPIIRPCKRKEIIQWTKREANNCKFEINLICPHCDEVNCSCSEYNSVIKLNQFEAQRSPLSYKHWKHFHDYSAIEDYKTKGIFYPHFKPIRYNMGVFSHYSYHVNNCLNINYDSSITYEIETGERNKIIVSCKEGQILLSYLAYPTDKEGLLMIPDNEKVIEFVIHYIAERLAWSKWFMNPDNKNTRRYNTSLQTRNIKLRAAKGALKIPDPDEWGAILDNYWYKVVPYSNFWENSFKNQTDILNKVEKS